jgi:DNA-binding transcriptional regulator YiaG
MTIAEEVRALRAALEEDTATFAARWRRSPRTVEDWEQGRRRPDPLAIDAMRALATRKKVAASATKRRQP